MSSESDERWDAVGHAIRSLRLSRVLLMETRHRTGDRATHAS